jgi:hypothetical protein
VTEQRLTLDELLDELRVVLVRRHTRRRRRVVSMLAVVAAGVTATVALGATYGHWLSPYTQGVNFAQCMRSNGVPGLRDPSVQEGPLSISRIDPSSPAFLATYKACQKYATSGRVGPPAPTAAQLRAAVEFSRCMRAHRFPRFPDPLATYGTGLTLARGEYFPPISTSELQSPAFRQGAKSCGVVLP